MEWSGEARVMVDVRVGLHVGGEVDEEIGAEAAGRGCRCEKVGVEERMARWQAV